MKQDDRTNTLREAVSYISKFREHTIAVYLDDAILKDIERYEIVQDILRSAELGLKIFVCYSKLDDQPLHWMLNTNKLKHFNFQDLGKLNVLDNIFSLNHVPLIFCEEVFFFHLVQAMNVRKIVFIGKSALFDESEELIRDINYNQFEELHNKYTFSGMENRVRLILSLPNKEEYRMHFISGHREGSFLKEILTCRGDGTMIYENHAYHNIRSAKLFDIASIFQIIEKSNKRGDINISISENMIKKKLNSFRVLSIDGEIHVIACVNINRADNVINIEYLVTLNSYQHAIILIKDFLQQILQVLQIDLIKSKIILERNKNILWLGMSPWFKEMGFTLYTTIQECRKEGIKNMAKPPLYVYKKKLS